MITESVPQQLLAEAVLLANELPDVLADIRVLAPDVGQTLAGAIKSSGNARTKGILEEATQKHRKLIEAGNRLPHNANVILSLSKQADFSYSLQEIQRLLGTADPEKLANEELLAQCTRTLRTLEDGPDVLALQVASVQIPLYSLVYFHAEVLRTFLGRPSVFHRTLDIAGKLFKALSKDLIGEVIPFLGVLEAVFEVTKPRLEQEMERMEHATQQMDRLFQLDDRFTDLLGQARVIELAMGVADTTIRKNKEAFVRDAAWLTETLAAAERT